MAISPVPPYLSLFFTIIGDGALAEKHFFCFKALPYLKHSSARICSDAVKLTHIEPMRKINVRRTFNSASFAKTGIAKSVVACLLFI
jgi:hypothetical protein